MPPAEPGSCEHDRLRVLHGPVNVGNQPWMLSRAERRLGLASDLVVNEGSWLEYPADRTLTRSGEPRAASLARRICFGIAAPFRYDVLHCYFGRSFLHWNGARPGGGLASRFLHADLTLARRLGRRVVMTLQGCDARLATASARRNAFTMCAEGRCTHFAHCRREIDARRRWLIDEILPLCDHVFYLNPELGHDVPQGSFLPYINVDIAALEPAFPAPTGRPRIVHAPTNDSIKGTPEITAALERLARSFDFELVLIKGRPHAEAMQLYRSADLAIDQIWAGWYGGLAVEMMALGKPVACYVRASDLEFVPAGMRDGLPVLQLRPDRLIEDLAAILERRAEWPEIGQRSRAFVERWHDADRLAADVVAAYRAPRAA